MKITIPALLLLAASAPLLTAATIAQWTFETNTPDDLPNTTTQTSVADAGSGTGKGGHASAATDYTTPAGNGSANAWSSNTWAVGDYWQFAVSTAGLESISLSWDQTSSGTGPRDFGLFYSTDGSTFSQYSTTYAVSQITWAPGTSRADSVFTRDLSAVTALDDQASLFFRLQDMSTFSANGTGTVAAGGTSRIDNFTVRGEVIPSPVPESAPGIAGLAGVLALMAAFRKRWAR